MPETSMHHRIVVGIDGSPAAADALRWTLGQARLSGAAVEAITCWHVPNEFAAQYMTGDVDWAADAGAILSTALDEVDPDETSEVIHTVIQGHPAHVLTEASARADLLVVGSRGHGGFTGLLVGSVSEYVIAHSKCPVLVTRHHDTA